MGNIDHVAIRVNDVEHQPRSIDDRRPGLTIRQQTADHAAFSVGASHGCFIVLAGEPTQNVHVAFAGEDDDVRRFHADATAARYRSNGEPGERPRYHDGYYAAYVLDPDRNNIEVVNHHRARIAILPARTIADGAGIDRSRRGRSGVPGARTRSVPARLEPGDRVARERTEQRRSDPC